MRTQIRTICSSSLMTIGCLLSTHTWAQSTAGDEAKLEEIVITAERREENLQKTSISITAVSGEEISEQGQSNVSDILKNVPGVVVVSSARGQTVSVRGLGFDLPPQVGENPVSMNYDGVYDFRSEAGIFGYFDLARVEVLRGPQGTLYGRNATAGVMNVLTNAPDTKEFQARGAIEAGSYDLRRAEGAVNVPLSDSFAARVAVVAQNRRGYLDNGQNDAVGSGARVRTLYKPSEDFSLALNAEYGTTGGKGPSFSDAASYEAGNPLVASQPSSTEVRNFFQSTRYWGQLDATVGPGVLTFIPSYQRAFGWNLSVPPPPCSVTVGSLCKNNDPILAEQESGELRFANAANSDVKWVAGLYYYSQTNIGDAMGASGSQANSTDSYAAFAQVTYPFADALRGIVGVRETQDKKGFTQSDTPAATRSDKRNAFDWKLGVEHDLAEASMLYATLASGHRPGGFNTFLQVTDPLFGSFYKPEKLISLELGSKNRFLDERLQLNASVYYYNYKNFQAADVFFDPSTGGLAASFLNVDKVKNYGAEIETQAVITADSRLNFSVNYVHARYDDPSFILHNSATVTASMDGRQLTHAPDWTIKGGYEYGIHFGDHGTLTPRVDVRYTDAQYVNLYPSATNLQGAYTTGDASLMYSAPSDKWSINAYLKNANDKVVKTAAFPNGYGTSDPRTWGVVFSAHM